jgi:osmoprotectant transport system ATP-binding protein
LAECVAVFELAGVSKRYPGFEALAPMDLCIVPSQTTVLIGPSGSGKSTLLRLLVRLIAPDTGVVRFEDQILSDDNALALRQRMGFVVQEGGLFPHLTAWDNVALMARYLRWRKAEIEARVHALAALTHFPCGGLARYPVQLSGGERQRVSLMRALMLDPDVLLLDEPLGALDPMIRFDLQNDLKEIFAALNKTVVMVTHDLSEAGFFAGTVVLMRAGRIIQQGAFEELMQAPADPFVERFVRAQRARNG